MNEEPKLKGLIRLRDFVVATTRMVKRSPNDETEQLAGTAPLLRGLVSHDDLLPYDTPRPIQKSIANICRMPIR